MFPHKPTWFENSVPLLLWLIGILRPTFQVLAQKSFKILIIDQSRPENRSKRLIGIWKQIIEASCTIKYNSQDTKGYEFWGVFRSHTSANSCSCLGMNAVSTFPFLKSFRWTNIRKFIDVADDTTDKFKLEKDYRGRN